MVGRTYRKIKLNKIITVILLITGIVSFTSVSAGAMGSGPPPSSPGGGPPSHAGPPAGVSFVETTNQVKNDHILAVTGRSGAPAPYLGLEVFPKVEGVWSAVGEPSNRYNPMGILTPFDLSAPQVDLNVSNTVDNANYIGGAMRFEAEIDATNRYDFEGAEFYVIHHNDELLEGSHMLGRLQTASTERFHKADFKLGGIKGTSPEPEVEQIRWLRGYHYDEYEPIWWEFRDDLDSRRKRSGIYPNLPYLETVSSKPGHYQVNYNIRSANREALVEEFISSTSARYKPFVPGMYDFSASIHMANGDVFETEKEFPVHGLVVGVEDELENPVSEEELKVTGCNYWPRQTTTQTDEAGRIKLVMQPNQTCRVYSESEQFLLSADEEREIPVLGGGVDVVREDIEIPARRIVRGKVRTASGDPFQSYQIEARPVGFDIDKRQRIIENNNLKLKVSSDEGGNYKLELPYGRYELKAYRNESKHYIRLEGSTAWAKKEATTTVNFPKKSYHEIISGGNPKEEINWEIIPLTAKIRAIVRKINSDGQEVYAQRETVRIKGHTPIGPVTKSGNTGVFRAIASFEDLPRGTYEVKVKVTENVLDGIPQVYSKVITLEDDSHETVKLGP